MIINLDNTIIHHIFISEDHNFYGHHGKAPGTTPMIEVNEVICEAGKGIVGCLLYTSPSPRDP